MTAPRPGRPRSAVHDGLPPRETAVLPELVAARAASSPDAPAVLFRDETWTYGELSRRMSAVACGLARLGVEDGAFVGAWLPNGPQGVLAWLGVNAVGAVWAPLHLAYRGAVLEHALNLSGARVLIAHRQLLPRLAGLDLAHLRTIVAVGDGDRSAAPGLDIVDWETVAAATSPAPSRPRDPWQNMAMIYTSGTTGPSKGVLCSYLHHFAYASHLLPDTIGEDDRFYLCTPLAHVAGTAALFGMVVRGGSIAIVDTFSVSRFWDDVRHFGATTTFIISSMANLLNKQPTTGQDAENPLRSTYMAPLLPDVQAFERRFGVAVYSAFGMTEVPSAIHTGFSPTNPQSCGRAVDPQCYELRIVDDADLEVPDGTVGELVLRHRYPWVLTSGYKDMPTATAEAWRNGWFHTGDYMLRNTAGDYFIVDRKKDSIRRRGENISSVEVETALARYPGIVEAAVVGVPSPDGAEDEVKAVVVPRGTGFDPADLIRFAIPLLPHFMVPRYVETVEALPKTASLKVEKFVLRQSGVSERTWDRVAAGVDVPHERIG